MIVNGMIADFLCEAHIISGADVDAGDFAGGVDNKNVARAGFFYGESGV